MLSVFLFKSNARGAYNSNWQYIKELTEALLIYTDVKLFIVNYHYNEYKEFSTEKLSPKFMRINIPSSQQHILNNSEFEEKYASVVVNFLSEFIPKNEKIVFQTTCIDDFHILKRLKKKYPFPVLSIANTSINYDLSEKKQKILERLNLKKISNDGELVKSCEKEMYELVDKIISFTEVKKELLVKNYEIDRDKIYKIHNGIEYNNYQILSLDKKLKLKYELGFTPDEKIVLFCCKIDPFNELFFLIDSFIEACKYLDNLRLIIIGDGQIIECIQKYQSFYGKITFTGFLSQEKTKQFYQIADIGIVHSNYDHCSYTLLEMIANRIPVVLFRSDEYNEIFDDTQCFFVCPPINKEDSLNFINELKNAILLILHDKKLPITLTQNALQRMHDSYSAKVMTIEMSSIYASL